MPKRPAGPILSRRRLNRALLARQLLMERARLPTPDAIEHLVGLQAQVPAHPYQALWARLADFDPADLSARIERREAVRITLMRATIHLVTARDCRAIRAVLAPNLARALQTATPFGRRLAGLDLDALTIEARAILERRPLSANELGKALAERWPGADAVAMGTGVGLLTPLVQVTPRGLWRRSGAVALTPADSWISLPREAPPAPNAPNDALDDLALRYLRAFGPASVADFAAWSRLTGAREIFERLRPNLRIFADEAGRELFDAPDAPLPGEDAPAPIRFLPEYDNLLLSHADRTRIATVADRRALVREGGFHSAVLVDGFVRATWGIARPKGESPVLEIAPLGDAGALLAAQRDAIEAEAVALLAFLDDVSPAEARVRFLAEPRGR